MSLNTSISDLRADIDRHTDPLVKAGLYIRLADMLEAQARVAKYYNGEAELLTTLGNLQRQLNDIDRMRRDLSERLDEMAAYVNRGKLPRDSRFFDLRYKAADLSGKISDFKFMLERIFQF